MARRAPSVLARALREDNRGSEFVEKLILIILGALALGLGVSRFSGGIKGIFVNSGRNLESNVSGSPQVSSTIASWPKMEAAGDTSQFEGGLLGKKGSQRSEIYPPAVPTSLPAPVWTKPGPSPILYVGLGTGPESEAATLASESS